MAEVVLEKVCKQYEGGSRAVDDFSLVIRDGEFLVLVGPSGCGKSTTLRMIAGLEEISSGTISISGRCVNRVPPKDRDIAMVFQNYALYPHMSVYDNMAFGLKLRGLPRREIEARVSEAAEILGLGDLLKRLPKQLSGGQRQRVAVGRAIVRKPQVFLFDEPLSNLDAKMRVEMRSEISRLHRRLKATMIYVTHDQVEAMTMGDRIVVMANGTIQQVAPPLEVYRRPANLFVAGFIGTPPMNVLRGRFETREGGGRFRHAQGEVVLPARWDVALRPFAGRELLLGFRPESLGGMLVPGTTQNTVCGTVDVVEPMGAETFVQMVVADGTRIVARVGAEQNFAPGESVRLPLDCGGIRFFEVATGQAIPAEGEEAQ
ncbi:MAG TPA: sn-glycerol-3-phosphate ABC transporter ATP-binding protein UgpC [Kiritimatiellia bacterium]|nr:sn-glycerol-3-phosphate ABC transporter ATP-binding protein UgpC [Kiritimatiellia bacterium]HRU71058.1 sn-glycerol-3-phosphate ABC transporter ATP-binding protein UgpC [Kiritimatiellia bacterium]